MSPRQSTLQLIADLRLAAARVVALCDTTLSGAPFDRDVALQHLLPALRRLGRTWLRAVKALKAEDFP